MKSYLHPNSAVTPPTMMLEEPLALYRAIAAGTPVVIRRDHFTAGDLELVAERLRCDEVAAALVALCVDALVIDRKLASGLEYVEASVTIINPQAALDAEAAHRVVQRMRSGLTVEEAVARTLAQCAQPTLSEHALVEMEREGDAVVRRLGRPVPGAPH